MKTLTTALMTDGALLAATSASANFVSDGDFSSPSGGPSYIEYAGGSTMGPWTVTGDSVDLIGGYWQSPTGTGSVDLDGANPGGLTQSLTLAAGSYTLTFDLSGNPDGGIPLKTVDVSIGNVTDHAFTFLTGSNTHSNMEYVLETLYFTTTGNTTLTFDSADLTGSPYGPVIGNVSVTSGTPEPATWGLMILGFAGLGAMARSRRKLAAA